VRPIIEYGCVIWGNCGTKTFLSIERIQYRIIISVTGAMKGSSNHKLNVILGLPSIEKRCQLITVNMIKNMYYRESPGYLNEILDKYRPNHRYYVRDNLKLIATGGLYSSFFERGIKLWNSLPIEIRLNNSKVFKSLVLRHWNIPTIYKCSLSIIDRRSEIHLNRFLVDFSQLKDDLFTHNLIENNECNCNDISIESRKHYLFECQNFMAQRIIFLDKLLENDIISVDTNLSPRNLFPLIQSALKSDLYNNNKRQDLLIAIQNFIKSSSRFN